MGSPAPPSAQSAAFAKENGENLYLVACVFQSLAGDYPLDWSKIPEDVKSDMPKLITTCLVAVMRHKKARFDWNRIAEDAAIRSAGAASKRWSRLLQKIPEIPGLVTVKPVVKPVEEVNDGQGDDDDGAPETPPASPRKPTVKKSSTGNDQKPKAQSKRKTPDKSKVVVKPIRERKTASTGKRPSKKRKVEEMEEVQGEEEKSSEGDHEKSTEEGEEEEGYETEKGVVKEGEEEGKGALKEVEMVDAEATAAAVDMSINMSADG